MFGIDNKWIYGGGALAALGIGYLLLRAPSAEAETVEGPAPVYFSGGMGGSYGVQAGGILPSSGGYTSGAGTYADPNSAAFDIASILSSLALPSSATATATNPATTGAATVTAVAPRIYKPTDRADAGAVTALYSEFLGRAPESGVAAAWARVNATVADVRKALTNSDEFNIRYNQVVAANPVAGYTPGASAKDAGPTSALTYNAVNEIYNEFLGRNAEAGVAPQWLNAGGTVQDLRNALANSEEFKLRFNTMRPQLVN